MSLFSDLIASGQKLIAGVKARDWAEALRDISAVSAELGDLVGIFHWPYNPALTKAMPEETSEFTLMLADLRGCCPPCTTAAPTGFDPDRVIAVVRQLLDTMEMVWKLFH